jgi:hypothetical protein
VAHADLRDFPGAAVLVEEAEVRHEGAGEGEEYAEIECHGLCLACDAADARVHRQGRRSALLPRIDSGRLAVETCGGPKGLVTRMPLNADLTRPLLLVDIDGVVSLFGFAPHAAPAGSFHSIDGIPHFLSATAAAHLLALGEIFELVWCSGWEERANEYLPALLGLPAELPFLRFAPAVRAASGLAGSGAERAGRPPIGRGHWKLDAIDAYAEGRALAWIDDCLDEACDAWAAARTAPTLLVRTQAAVGIDESHVAELIRWAAASELT